MGGQVRAICPCGYDQKFTVGGARHSHNTNSYFPYRCRECGLVSVNIALGQPACPNVAGHEVVRVGGSFKERLAKWTAYENSLKPKKLSLFDRLRGKRPEAIVPLARPIEHRVKCQAGDHEIYDEPYQCPKCKQVTMLFSRTGLKFD